MAAAWHARGSVQGSWHKNPVVNLAAIGKLRPCEHQVAGHLFEEGKAGSLVDDRGHFYKPIQQGPRGDRERHFYEAIAAALKAEEQQQQQAQVNGRGGAAFTRTSPRSIRTKLPSFRERHDSGRAAVQIAQRDEFGLLGTPTLRDLRVGHDEWLGRSPDSEGAELTAEHLMDGFSLHHRCQTDGSDAAQQQQAGSGGGGRRQAVPHVPSSLADPKHAEVAALLGQPIYDVELSQPQSPCRRYLNHHDHNNSWGPSPLGGEGLAAPQPALYLFPTPSEQDYSQQPAPREGRPVQLGEEAPPPPASAADMGSGKVAAGQAARPLSPAGAAHNGGQAPAAEPGSVSAEAQQPGQASSSAARKPPSPNNAAADMGASLRSASAPCEHAADLLFARSADGAVEDGGGSAATPAAPQDGPAAGHDSFSHTILGAEVVLESLSSGLSTAYSPKGDPLLWPKEGVSGSMAAPTLQLQRRPGFHRLPFSLRNALLLDIIPKFYGVLEADGRTFLELEDLTRNYRRPSIIDIKVGFRTWYPSATQAYIERCQAKDAATTQASLGFKICGMQVYRHSQGGYWRASKRWCKTLPAQLVDKALLSFAHNENGIRPEHVYGSAHGAIAKLQSLESWFELQRDFHFYSSSVLILYEGGATAGEDPRVRVRFVDFAHTFKLEKGQQQRDHNFLAGLRAIISRLSAVMRSETADSLA